ncbi:Adenylate/guanylate cyclase with Chase sensor (plasmid) [Neorhizobium galegae bv. officinalis bv. officinalis str. HAMBI 1141]|uniref:Adenylate/guanylate cyclase with Chase sensor n=1 Tax=Neorhizobium galegae bv. officinalis bv. officinalis str. HAMBI 1141 TaxID=1028801 RepID=A0A068TIU5_NEOGA|nr:adenylate/guanylate cyclase domain-containing protein [Neorhizobium galegae]CDN58283.1 Adenylate/guanylate cyclase with Chase sensor [Neorhizobium galegae bv. officinalis bv. officinalis str. HAMBI 1141]
MAGRRGFSFSTLRFFSSRSVQVAILAAFFFAAAALLTRLPGWPLIDYRAFDYLSTVPAEPIAQGGPIVVAIDEPSLAEVNVQWPWPRGLHAKLVSRLRAAGAKVIGLDIIFSEPSAPAEDEALAATLGPDVVLAGDETLVTSNQADQFIRVMPLQMFSDRQAPTGIASVGLHRDGVLRDMPDFVDGFAAVVATAAGIEVDQPEPGSLIQVFGGPRAYPTVSYYQALDPENFLPPGLFKDRIAIVGLSLQNAPSIDNGGADAFPTSHTIHDGKLLAGAEVQATIFDNLRLKKSITEASRPMRQLLLLVAVVAAAVLIWKGTGWHTVAGGAVVIVVLFIGSYVTLRFGRVFLSPIAASLAFAGMTAAQAALDYAQERKSRRQIIRAFSQYLAPALVDQLARDPSKLKLGGEKRELSILFCDVRGFTTIAEQLKDDPQQLTMLINRLLTPLSDIALSHGGTIDKYIGDCLMAFWNAPLDDAAHAAHAVAAALDMLDSMQALNDDLEAEAEAAGRTYYPLAIGIGINTGECVVGNMGSTSRFDYSALGDAVNLAARLESASKAYGVPLLLGERTAQAVDDIFAVFELDRITVKGKTEEVPVCTVLRETSEAARNVHREFLEARYRGDVATQQTLAQRLIDDVPALSAYHGQAL